MVETHADNNVDYSRIYDYSCRSTDFQRSSSYGCRNIPFIQKSSKGKGLNTAVGDEGGFAPNLGSNEEALEALLKQSKQLVTSQEKTY